jgi:hypothetical protein
MFSPRRILIVATAVVALSAAASQAASFSFSNCLKFKTAFALPGVELPAGGYEFEVVNPGTDADVVRVTSKDGRHVYFMGFTTRVPRPAGMPKDRLVILGEARPGEAQPIAVWFPIDSPTGHRFLY